MRLNIVVLNETRQPKTTNEPLLTHKLLRVSKSTYRVYLLQNVRGRGTVFLFHSIYIYTHSLGIMSTTRTQIFSCNTTKIIFFKSRSNRRNRRFFSVIPPLPFGNDNLLTAERKLNQFDIRI